MSKTTITLIIIFTLFIGVLLFIENKTNRSQLIRSLTPSIISNHKPTETALSLSTNTMTVQRGQTLTIAVLITNADPAIELTQLELSYDPLVVTFDSITPGTFFTNPTIALDHEDPLTGRISYALRCPASQTSGNTACTNHSASTVAVITFTINSYTMSNNTLLSFLPKTVVRIHNGTDILQRTNPLQLTIGHTFAPVSTSTAIGSPAANMIRTLPMH